MAKGWTKERRERQAEAIRNNKPWEKSTGPKTEKGKRRSSMNAYKHGGRSKKMADISKVVALNKEFVHLFKFIFSDDDAGLLDSNELIKYLAKSKAYFEKHKNEQSN